MGDFVAAEITTDTTVLVDDAIDSMNANLEAAGFPGWTATDADLSVIMLGIIATIAVDVALVASTVLSAIFRAFGTQLLGIPYITGASATVTTTWVFTAAAPTGGYMIPAGAAVIIDGFAFYVPAEIVTATGATSLSTVQLIASETGTAYNNLGGAGVVVQLNDQIDWVQTVTTEGITANGQDAQTDEDYQDKLASTLRLQAPRPITADDFAAMVLSDLCEIQTGIVVGRATAVDGYVPSPLLCTGTTTNTSAAITAMTPPYPGAVPEVGATVTGTGIPGGATVIASPAPTTTGFSISANATSTNVGQSITVGSWTSVSRAVTVFVADSVGAALSSPQMTALDVWLTGFREANFNVYVHAPTYTAIYIACQIHVLPGYDQTVAATSVQAALVAATSPAEWGVQTRPASGAPATWLNASSGFNVVRVNKLIGIAESIPGVDYVPTGQMKVGTAPAPSGTVDVTLSGQAPLPQSDNTTVSVAVV